MDEYDDRYKPISPLGYIGFEILFAIPVIGLLAVIIIAIVARNKNVKNFAVAQLIVIILVMIAAIISAAFLVLSGITLQELVESAPELV